jgi:phage tail sheath protein FI
MAVTPTYPGVYVQEIPSGVRTIVGVPTSVALFIGRAGRGPIDTPLEFFNYTDFARTFGEDTSVGDMARQIRLFFMNGGTDCHVIRIANGATAATVMLKSEAGADSLRLTSKQAGAIGESIRATVAYRGPQPESTFDIDLFLWTVERGGTKVRSASETWKNLSMDPQSPLYAPTFLTQRSKLVDAQAAAGIAGAKGYSQSGRPVPYTAATLSTFKNAWRDLVGQAAVNPTHRFQISADGSPYVEVDLSGINVAGMTPVTNIKADLAAAIKAVIETAFTNAGVARQVAVTFEDGPAPAAPSDATALLRITTASATGDVWIRPAATDDAAAALMLGTEQGGLEVSSFAASRPAPTGITFRASTAADANAFGGLAQNAVTGITLETFDDTGAVTGTVSVALHLVTTNGADPMFVDQNAVTGGSSGIREKLGLIRDAINAQAGTTPGTFQWAADLAGDRLTIWPTKQVPENFVSTQLATAPTNTANRFDHNVRYYSVGHGGTSNVLFPRSQDFQTPSAGTASDGGPPLATDYQAAYELARRIDLFNLLILPADANPAQPMEQLYGPASVFCQQRRAFLLMDPPSTWTDPQSAKAGVAALRIGLVKDYSAVYYPQLTVNEGGLNVQVGPAGAIAGLMARIDGSRGVWKAPAGTEADLRGIVGLERSLSDPENGLLNPVGINVQRIFPNGIVSWGARTMDGADDFASEYKYIPIRRLALFMEETLYRGLKWVVFEPNGEPLWAQIRLNVGAFMHDLFRKGAFAGVTPREAYFVKCDRETTTPNDENLGIVNIWVGFAPLKPAEFVVLYLQQMAAQAEA